MELRNIEESETVIDFGNVSEPMSIDFHNICYKGANRKNATDRQYILQNVSGTFYSSRLTAIIGPNGSGKTTLLRILAGLQSNYCAPNIKLNGETFDRHSIGTKSLYILPHEFPLHKHLTAFETLKFTADFKLGRKTAAVIKLKLINNIIGELNLKACQNLPVSKLNESQRNVLVVGVGLILKSTILYLDLNIGHFEDKALMFVLRYLKMLVCQGRTIICAMDQPTTKMLQYFDDVMLLADGHNIYSGPFDKIDEVYSKVGIVRPPFLGQAEFILDIASQSEMNGQYQQLVLSNNFHSNGFTSDVINHQNWSYPNSCFYQFVILMQRSILSMLRDLMFVSLRLVANIVTGVFLGFVFYDMGDNASTVLANTSLISFMMLFVFFGHIIPNTLSIPADVAVFLQEQNHHYYSTNVYFTVKIITEFLQHIIVSTVFIVIVFFMTIQPASNFVYFWIIFMLITIVSLGNSLVICTAFPNNILRIYAILFINIPMMILSGIFINFNLIPWYFIPVTYSSYFRYGFEGAMNSIYGFNRPNLICSEEYCHFKRPGRYLQLLFTNVNMYWFDVAGLSIWIIILFVLFYAVLMFRVFRRK